MGVRYVAQGSLRVHLPFYATTCLALSFLCHALPCHAFALRLARMLARVLAPSFLLMRRDASC